MSKKFYLTSAIPYVNAAPHIGHAQEFVYADVIRRHNILMGHDVRYLCGADENALKIFQAAEKAGKEPQEFTDLHNTEFLSVAGKLNVHFDVWQRGSDTKNHFPSSHKLWSLCDTAGDIYKKTYTGLYCIGCELFYTPEELNENGECFEHPGKKLEEVSEENYFFKLSNYQDFLLDLIEQDTLEITPEKWKKEALAFVRKGLPDFSISRSRARARGWGIPVPGDPDQIMYVWFDALNIYQTGIGFGRDEEQYAKWWPQDVMVIGKGITRFHAIYWPAILKSAGLKLPKKLFIHGYLTVDGQKMSKSIGNVIDPLDVIKTYGTDATRYYLLREIPPASDGDFSYDRMNQLYQSDLANELGNLLSRVTTIAAQDAITIVHGDIQPEAPIEALTSEFRFNEALEKIWEEIRALNKEINEREPWKKNTDERKDDLESWLKRLYQTGHNLKAYLPDTADKIIASTAGAISKIQPLFPRVTH